MTHADRRDDGRRDDHRRDDRTTDAADPTGHEPGPGPGRSPRILHLEWGRTEVEGMPPGKDFVLHPGGGHPWDWGLHGTRHVPGIRPGDVRELLARGAEVVVLGLGMQSRLQIAPETVQLLREAGVEVHAAATPEAVEIYNALTAGTRPVGGLFHSTC
ncbi:Mth938-like domain-containing protein [Streptomyces sp. NPDC085612]|uniref:Mth938-like domain-containing protein n=1 Tax=Streptomyces sp. NPDC085612 TaxID=3365732 RepID=UPI0037CF6D67